LSTVALVMHLPAHGGKSQSAIVPALVPINSPHRAVLDPSNDRCTSFLHRFLTWQSLHLRHLRPEGLPTLADPGGKATTGVRFTFSEESYSRRAECGLPTLLVMPNSPPSIDLRQ
jgi:hypothetical protein